MTTCNTPCKGRILQFFFAAKVCIPTESDPLMSSLKVQIKEVKLHLDTVLVIIRIDYRSCKIKSKMNVGPLLKSDSFIRTGSYM